jgi:excisionase family DNA binding protein
MLDTVTILSLGQAARLTGLGKTTLARAIKAGRLSATRNETGGYRIDASELARVFPFPAPDETGFATTPVVHHATTEDQVATLREMMGMLKAQNTDLRHDRDHWREMAQRLALSPPKPSPAPPAETPAPTPAPTDAGGWLYCMWRWMRKAA